jgi:hypothetical protein
MRGDVYLLVVRPPQAKGALIRRGPSEAGGGAPKWLVASPRRSPHLNIFGLIKPYSSPREHATGQKLIGDCCPGRYDNRDLEEGGEAGVWFEVAD